MYHNSQEALATSLESVFNKNLVVDTSQEVVLDLNRVRELRLVSNQEPVVHKYLGVAYNLE